MSTADQLTTRRRFSWRRLPVVHQLRQSVGMQRGMLIIGLVQISLMTGMLYIFMPDELNMSWPAFIAIYCIAFVAGQLSNVPAGLGVLEAALLLMLPQVPPAKLLGAAIEFLDLGGDCRLDSSAANNLAVARTIRKERADVLLSPTAVRNQHPDHIVVSQLCRHGARLARYGGLGELNEQPAHTIKHHFEYAITPEAEPPNDGVSLRIDIGAKFERWVELMECHQTQLRTRRYVDLQTARARSLGLEAGVEYAQVLFPTADFLIANLDDLPLSVRLF